MTLADEVFAVVDLETTGTQREEGHHIIQFGCAIIKNLKIVKTYSFMINPKRKIPKAVEALTGIHDKDLIDKPDFSYFAPKILEILKDTIFVAHNINFDLPFLNYELANFGFDQLTNRAIDTVELAQVTFPTLASYKLRDLTTQLHLKHLNPHKADSDAYATAGLLLDIIDKLSALPQATLNTLNVLAKGLLRDTNLIFKEIADESRQNKRPLGKQYLQVRSLVLHRNSEFLQHDLSDIPRFPITDAEKEKLFDNKVTFRRGQVTLINRLHDFIEVDKKNKILIEAPNGTGKTFSYLFSFAYALNTNRKLVIATTTQVLQEQVLRQEIPQLLKVTGLSLNAQIVKSSSHYLDLDGFMQTLMHPTTNQPMLVLQMRILIWLTQTETGDLDELQLANFNAPLFAQIQHPGDARVGTAFAKYDFWNLARFRQEQADILVTNHAYLANHYQDSIWGANPYLVVDEAHRFADNVTNSRNDSMQFESFWGVLAHLRNLIFNSEDNLAVNYNTDSQISYLLSKLEPNIGKLIHTINELQRLLYSQRSKAISQNVRPNNTIELGFESKTLFADQKQFNTLLKIMQQRLEECRNLTNQVLYQLYQEHDAFLPSEEAILNEISDEVDKLDFYTEKAYSLTDKLTDQNIFENLGFMLIVTDPSDPLSTNLSWLTIDPQDELKSIYEHFSKIVLISATLTDQNNFDYIENVLALEKQEVITYQAKQAFNLTDHLKVLGLSDPKISKNPNDDQFNEFIGSLLPQVLDANHILVLFTNLETIREVFGMIVNRPEFSDYEILAQRITGSNDRISKRFTVAKKAIILGANSFWEGVDFFDTKINLVIATKLPFDAPDQPEIKLRQIRLERKGIDVFKQDTLPRAIIRFKQGCGRLIRGENDQGIFAILDQRLWNDSYGSSFIQSLPVSPKKVDQKQLINNLKLRDQK